MLPRARRPYARLRESAHLEHVVDPVDHVAPVDSSVGEEAVEANKILVRRSEGKQLPEAVKRRDALIGGLSMGDRRVGCACACMLCMGL